MELNLAGIAALLIAISIYAGWYARLKGRNPYMWAFLALIPALNALVLVVLYILPAREEL